MKRISLLLIILAMVFGLTVSAQAAIIDITKKVDASAGSISDIVDVNGNPAKKWTSASITFDPISVSEGDTLELHINFKDAQYLEMASITGKFFSGNEEIDFTSTVPGISVAGISTLQSLLGLTGDLDLLLPHSTSFTTGDLLAGTVVGDYSDTWLKFRGLQLDTIYTTLTGGPAIISQLYLHAVAENVTVGTIPEPSTLFLLGSGLAGIIGFGRKRLFKKTRP